MKLFLARKVLKIFDYISQRKIINFLKLILKKNLNTVLDVGPEQRVLNVILKADFLGSMEAIEEVLKQFGLEDPKWGLHMCPNNRVNAGNTPDIVAQQ
jgi:translation initiation factor IF-2